MIRNLLVVTAVAAAGLAAGAAPASADLYCAGTDRTVVVCVDTDALPTVDPTGGSIDDCVHVGPPPCTPVSIPVPTVDLPPRCRPLVLLSGDLIEQHDTECDGR